VLGLAGRAPASLDASSRALRTLRREGEAIWEARLLKNRGVLLSERGDAAAAGPDLERARDLYAELGATLGAAGAEISLARLALLRGDVVECLAQLDAAESRGLPPRALCDVELIRAEALVEARLPAEALAALRAALGLWERAGADDYVLKARLEIARLSLLAGDPGSARELAGSARRSLAAAGQAVHAARATGIALAAAVAAGAVSRSSVRSGRRAAAVLAGAGWRHEALRVRLLVARAAIELGRLRTARRELDACSALHRRGNVADRTEAWHAEALLRLAEGDRAGAERALRTGLRLLDDYRAALGATELRATASTLGVELAELGLRLALGENDPRRILAWAERLRASALRLPRVSPPDDPELRALEEELRQVGAGIRRAEDEGRSTRALDARQIALETAIRRRSRHASAGSGPSVARLRPGGLARRLGPRSLVAYVELDGVLRAVIVAGGRSSVVELGPTAKVEEQLEWLRFALGRIARSAETRPETLEAATVSAAAAATDLDRLLVGPLELGDGPLVVVPTGSLHALPWSMLPSLRGRPVVVAPSAAVWLALDSRPRPTGERTALAAGPRLSHAETEIESLAHLYPRAEVLTGAAATAPAVLRAVDGAALAHVACHGSFRSDSPLFSSLELADGNLTALDLQRLGHPPDVLVLSACNLALSVRHPGDELLGVAAALLGMGTRTIVASVVPVPDRTAGRLMLAFHRGLTAGDPPAAALAAAQADAGAALAGFVCLGAG
jgi:hypothetical protein